MDDIKVLWKDLKQHPAFLVTMVFAIVLLIYFVYKQNNSGNASVSTSGITPVDVYTISNTPPAAGGTTTPTGGTTTGTTHANGTTFLGPTGVKHYIPTGNETLSQIATKFGLSSWNDIYAIPDNQKLFGKLDSTAARGYIPVAGMTITLPPTTSKGFS